MPSDFVVITVSKVYAGYRATCDSCRYTSNRHADKRQARKAAERHVTMKHPGRTVQFKGEL